jgi:hypothetical protein
MREYGKVFSTFWSSETIRAMGDDGRLLSLYLMTSPHSTIAGVFRLPDGYVAEDLGWPPERVREGFTELLRNGFANRCERTKWVWVRKHFDWNKPDNPNQRKAAAKIALSVPNDCAWKHEYMRASCEVLAIEWDDDWNGSETVTRTVPEGLPEPFRNQEQKQEQKQEQEQRKLAVHAEHPKPVPVDNSASPPEPPQLDLTGEPPPSIPDCPHLEILRLWEQVLPAMPQHDPARWRGEKAVHLRTRWRETAQVKRWVDKAQGIAYFRKLFGYVGQSRFLTGKVPPRTQGQPAFQIELAWLVNPTNWDKVHEGKYHSED